MEREGFITLVNECITIRLLHIENQMNNKGYSFPSFIVDMPLTPRVTVNSVYAVDFLDLLP